MPQSFLDLFNQDASAFNIAGGFDIANLERQSKMDAAAIEQERRNFGLGLLQELFRVQGDPMSIVPAMQAFGATGGGVNAPASALAQATEAGASNVSPFGSLAQNLLRDLGVFAGATPVNPNTGRSFTPAEIAYMNIIQARQTQAPTAQTSSTVPVRR